MSVGYSSPLDWSFVPAGAPPPPANCGYHGIVDWSGVGCGRPTGTPPEPVQPPSTFPGFGHNEKRKRRKGEPDEPVDYAEVLREPARLFIFGFAPRCHLGARMASSSAVLAVHAASGESQTGTQADGATLALAGALPDSLLMHQLPAALLEIGWHDMLAAAGAAVAAGEIVVASTAGDVARG